MKFKVNLNVLSFRSESNAHTDEQAKHRGKQNEY